MLPRTPINSAERLVLTGPLQDPAASEEQLLARLQAGDESAFEEVIEKHGGRLLAVARRLLRNDDDAEDALQDGLVSALRALKTFRGECQLATWLHRIVVNAALTKLRARRRHPEQPIEALLPTYTQDGHRTTAVPPCDVQKALIDEEVRAQMRAAIDALPESYRTVLLLRDIEELDTAAVARLLGTTTDVVKTRLHRARQALITLMTPALSAAKG